MESWENTTYNSPLYNEMLSFRNLAKNWSRDKLLYELYDRIDKYIMAGDLNLALLFLNELELLFDIKETRYPEYEHIIATAHQDEMKKIGRANCQLVNPPLPPAPRKIGEFRNRHKGGRCFILGNGPSLNKLDLSLLKNEITFGVNSIFLNFPKMGYEVTYYAIEDSHVIRERFREVGEMRSPLRFIPYHAANQIPFSPNNIYVNVVYDYTRYKGFPFFSADASRRLWVGGTVSYINMQLAYYMGFDEVYLIGFDHSYTIPDSAEITGNDIKSTTDDPNHFHPDYFGKDFHWHIPLVERMELGYKKADYAFSQKGAKIYNATPGGKLEVFERIDYNDIFKKSYPVPQSPALEKPDISIIIPSYNRGKTLIRAIDSALDQYGIQPEVIVVNDGSTDSTDEICQYYASRHPNFKYISQQNKGCGGARNSGLDIASAPYVTFLDSDDSFDPDFLYRALARIKESGADILDFDYKLFQNGKNTRTLRGSYCLDTGIASFKNLATTDTLSATERIYRTDFLRKNKIRFLENCFHEDLLFTIQTHFHADRIDFIPVGGYNCYLDPGSITGRIKDENLRSLALQFESIRNFLLENDILDELHRLYHVFCFRIIRDTVLSRVNANPDIAERTEMLRKVRKFMRDLGFLDYKIISLVSSYDPSLVNSVLNGIFATSPAPRKQLTTDTFHRVVFGSGKKA